MRVLVADRKVVDRKVVDPNEPNPALDEQLGGGSVETDELVRELFNRPELRVRRLEQDPLDRRRSGDRVPREIMRLDDLAGADQHIERNRIDPGRPVDEVHPGASKCVPECRPKSIRVRLTTSPPAIDAARSMCTCGSPDT